MTASPHITHNPTYQTPYRSDQPAFVFAPPVRPLFLHNFTVTHSVTGVPIQGAQCLIYEGLNGTGDADSAFTDSQGKAGFNAEWFRPMSWSVSKEGYLNQTENEMGTQINVALVPTVVKYTTQIYAGQGGLTEPTGEVISDPDFTLTVKAIPLVGFNFSHWVFKGLNVGSQNPGVFVIDRNALSIYAVFTDLPVPPPPNGNDNGNGDPPIGITKRRPVFNQKLLRATKYQFKEVARRAITDIDLNLLIDARVEYVVQYTEGSVINAGAFIELNGEEIVYESLKKGEAKQGVVNVTHLIQKTSNFTITVHSTLGNYEEVMYTVTLVLVFSEEPPVPPGTDDPTWVSENAWWLALAGGAVLLGGVALMLIRPQTPQIIVVGK